ncbi:glycoside hydrolase [Cladorrhinum sp. PSN259]|nr:glycoside hydrolase [Cladorrhinum sp. PSN259]
MVRPKGALPVLLLSFLNFIFQASSSSSPSSSSSSTYTLVDTFNSSNFFSEFHFFSQPDPTNGFVEYVNASTANRQSLAGYSEGGIYLGVDYHNVTTTGRKSVRVTSNNAYTTGLFIADIAHMPSGRTHAESCGIWPAYWMFGPSWPNSGEIDILEGVNAQRSNSITLHTGPGCRMSNRGSVAGTKLVSSNCQGNSGCGQETQSASNYGAGFNSLGGGYYVMEWTQSAISVWFFPRRSSEAAQLINALTNTTHGNIDITSSLGQPLATFVGGSNCSISDHFADHSIVFDTTFCGDWAGQVWQSDSACSALAQTCEEWVGQNPEKFVGAYWLINEIRVYQKGGDSNTKRRKREVAFNG